MKAVVVDLYAWLMAMLRGDCEVVDRLAVDLDLALADLLQAGDHLEGGRLAAAGGADEHEELAVGHVERELVDRCDAGGGIALGQVPQCHARQSGQPPKLRGNPPAVAVAFVGRVVSRKGRGIARRRP